MPGTRTTARTATLAMLFSDIEGSTRLLQQLGSAYAEVLMDHRAILRRAFSAHGGDEQGTEGDSSFVTFASASQAVQAAAAAQRALASHVWPDGAAVRVHMGVHIGEGLEPGHALAMALEMHAPPDGP